MPDQALAPAETLGTHRLPAPPEARKRTPGASPAARDSATAAEVDAGRRPLRRAIRGLANGGAACFSCHRLGTAVAHGGTLGPDLSTAYARYQDSRAVGAARALFPAGARFAGDDAADR
jgi:hypothetical protein